MSASVSWLFIFLSFFDVVLFLVGPVETMLSVPGLSARHVAAHPTNLGKFYKSVRYLPPITGSLREFSSYNDSQLRFLVHNSWTKSAGVIDPYLRLHRYAFSFSISSSRTEQFRRSWMMAELDFNAPWWLRFAEFVHVLCISTAVL